MYLSLENHPKLSPLYDYVRGKLLGEVLVSDKYYQIYLKIFLVISTGLLNRYTEISANALETELCKVEVTEKDVIQVYIKMREQLHE